MQQISREIINLFIVNRFSCLQNMYKQAEIDARLERDERLFKDWQEWAELIMSLNDL
jgi:hypothetical protein